MSGTLFFSGTIDQQLSKNSTTLHRGRRTGAEAASAIEEYADELVRVDGSDEAKQIVRILPYTAPNGPSVETALKQNANETVLSTNSWNGGSGAVTQHVETTFSDDVTFSTRAIATTIRTPTDTIQLSKNDDSALAILAETGGVTALTIGRTGGAQQSSIALKSSADNAEMYVSSADNSLNFALNAADVLSANATELSTTLPMKSTAVPTDPDHFAKQSSIDDLQAQQEEIHELLGVLDWSPGMGEPHLLGTATGNYFWTPKRKPGSFLLFVARYTYGFTVHNVYNPRNPTLVNSIDEGANVYDIALNGNWLYAAAGGTPNGLGVYDISDENNIPAGTWRNDGGTYYAVHYDSAKDIIVCSCGSDNVHIYSAANPGAPTLLSTIDPTGTDYARWADVSGDYVYIALYAGGLDIWNISNLSAPTFTSHTDAGGYYYSVDVQTIGASTFAFCAAITVGVKIYNVDTPATPVLVGTIDAGGYEYWCKVSQSGSDYYLILCDYTAGFYIFDVNDPSNPSQIANVVTAGAWRAETSWPYIYISNYNADLDIYTTEPTLLTYGKLTLGAEGTNPDDAVTKSYVDNISGNSYGVEDRSAITMSFDDATRTFTIAPTGADWNYFIAGTKHTISSTMQLVLSNTVGWQYIYIDSAETLGSTTTFDLSAYCWLASVNWDIVGGLSVQFLDEAHGTSMPWATIKYLHEIEGTQHESGLEILPKAIDGDGTVGDNFRFAVSDGSVRAQDIEFSIVNDSPQTLSPTAYVPVLHRYGTSWRIFNNKTTSDFANAFEIGFSNYPRLNVESGGVWTLQLITNGYYFCGHFFASTDLIYPIYVVSAQAEYPTVEEARRGALDEIRNMALPANDAPIGSIIMHFSTSYTNYHRTIIVNDGQGNAFVDFRKTRPIILYHHLLAGLNSGDDHEMYVKVQGRDNQSIVVDGTISVGTGSLGVPKLRGTISSGQLQAAVRAPTSMFVFTANYASGIFVYNISDPDAIVQVSNKTDIDNANDVWLNGTILYTASSGMASGIGLGVYDVTNPASIPNGTFDNVDDGGSLWVEGNYLYMAGMLSPYLRIYDITVPNAPSLVHTLDVGNTGSEFYPIDVEVYNDIAYLAVGNNGLVIYDVTNKTSPTYLGGHYTGGYAYTDLSYIVIGGTKYVCCTTLNDLYVYDVSAPATPTIVASLGVNDTCNRCMAFEQDHIPYVAFAAAGAGLQIYDLSTPSSPQQVSGTPIVGARLAYYSKPFIVVSAQNVFRLYDVGPDIQLERTVGGGRIRFPNTLTNDYSAITQYNDNTAYDSIIGASGGSRNWLELTSLEGTVPYNSESDAVSVRSGHFVIDAADTTIVTASDSKSIWQSYYRSRGTLAAPSQVINGDQIAILGYRGYGSAGWQFGGQLRWEVVGSPGAHVPTRMRVLVDDGSSLNSAFEVWPSGVVAMPRQSFASVYYATAGTAWINVAGIYNDLTFPATHYDRRSEMAGGTFTPLHSGAYQVCITLRIRVPGGITLAAHTLEALDGGTIVWATHLAEIPALPNNFEINAAKIIYIQTSLRFRLYLKSTGGTGSVSIDGDANGSQAALQIHRLS